MKYLFTLLALTTASTFAHADFVPGRVRPGMVAQMDVKSADGQFSAVQAATASLNFEDGKSEAVSVSVSFPNAERLTLPIVSKVPSDCGTVITAQLDERAVIRLEDFTRIRCRIYVKNPWHISVRLEGEGGAISALRLEGKPEFVFVTL